jgi:hypothetical protein
MAFQEDAFQNNAFQTILEAIIAIFIPLFRRRKR